MASPCRLRFIGFGLRPEMTKEGIAKIEETFERQGTAMPHNSP
jgi:hypothetical protein